MQKSRILVVPAGTEIAFEIHNALKYSKFVELYGATSVDCHADFVFKNCINNIPFPDNDDYIDSINSIVDKYEIDYIYPAHDSVQYKLTCESEKLHTKVITSDIDTVKICRFKNKTYEFFNDCDFVPIHYKKIEEISSYPVFIKPNEGQGSMGARRVPSKEELKNILNDGTEYTICEYLSGNEYTVDCFTDKNGDLRIVSLRDRERIRAGIAVRSRHLENDNSINKIAKTINDRLSFCGAWFFQVKKNEKGEYKLMEISPRIPGTMCVSRNLGINFPLLTLYNFWGYDIDILENDIEILMDRSFISRYKTNIEYTTVYLDFDDTVYIDGQVNAFLIAFLYQCVNQNKIIILLTKHCNNIYDSLSKFKISKDLFDKIISIEADDDKSKYIEDEKSIFIDDSFSERKKISEKIGIPVYDLDMIESLIDWRR